MIIAWDTETALISPARQAPPLACVSYKAQGQAPGILATNEALEPLQAWLEDKSVTLVGHNVAYDMAVVAAQWPSLVPLIFQAYDDDRVTDTMLRQKLLDIAAGCYRGRMGDDNHFVKYGYSLDDLVYRVRGTRLKKDGWRMFYAHFINVPTNRWEEKAKELQAQARALLEQGMLLDGCADKDVRAMIDSDPSECLRYPVEDAEATSEVYESQDKHAEFLTDQYRQSRGAFALHLSSAWGIRTDYSRVAEFEQATLEHFEELKSELIQAGLVRVNGTRDMKAAMAMMESECASLGIPLRLTAGGQPSLDKDACDTLADLVEDPSSPIRAYSDYLTTSKVLNNDVQMLLAGAVYPVHPRYDLAETGRSTCSKPNIQNLRRKKGIREAFVSRPGKVFAQADFEGLELHTLAQVCKELVGYSKLGDVLNEGLDPHSALAADILGVSYEQILAGVKDKSSRESDARQAAKVANFGYIAGLGPKKLVYFARKTYGVNMTENQAYELKCQWLDRWSEMRQYFANVAELCNNEAGTCQIEQLYTQRKRGGCKYTNACSSYVQGLGADAAKRAIWLVTREMYTNKTSPLFGSRIVAFIHDEIIAEVPEATCHEAANELSIIMCKGANEFVPDYPVKAPPLVMRYWSKDAKAVYDTNGKLIPWS